MSSTLSSPKKTRASISNMGSIGTKIRIASEGNLDHGRLAERYGLIRQLDKLRAP